MAIFKPYIGPSSNLTQVAVKEGNFIITTDEKKVYVDTATERMEMYSGLMTADTKYAASDVVAGAANSAKKLTTESAGSATKPVYFANGIPVAGTHTLKADVPADAKFTDTTYSLANGNTLGLVKLSQYDSQSIAALWETLISYGYSAHPTSADEEVLTKEQTLWLMDALLSNDANINDGVRGAKDLFDKIATAEMDNNGVITKATILASALPSYVDDVLEFTSVSNFPAADKAESGKIYVDTSTNKTYRWSGTQYVEISSSLALGETSSTAYRGDLGAAAYKHAVTNKGSAFASGLYKITTNVEGHVTAATAVTSTDISGLGVKITDTTYNVFSSSENGLVNKPTAAQATSGSGYYLGADNAWHEVKPGVSEGTGISITNTDDGSAKINLATSGAIAGSYGPTENVSGTNNTTISIPAITVDAYGRVTSITSYTLTNQNTTYGNASTTYKGIVKIGNNISVSSGTISLTAANVTAALGYTPSATDTIVEWIAF